MSLRRTSAAVHARRSILTVALSLLAIAAGATAAQAASSIAITVGADPVEGITTQVGVTGSVSSTNEYYYLAYKPAGGLPCGANYSADDGIGLLNNGSSGQAGPFARSVNLAFPSAGSYLVCAWLQSNSTTVTAVDAKTVQVRIPKLSLAISAPTAVAPGQTFQITTTSQAEAQRDLWVYALVDTGRGCPANASAASDAEVSRVMNGRYVLGGPTTSTENLTLQNAGQYLLCGYIHYNGSSKPPEATASAVFNVVAPPPPPPPPPSCVVPAVVKDEPLALTRSRLTAASCSAGKARARGRHDARQRRRRRPVRLQRRTVRRARDPQQPVRHLGEAAAGRSRLHGRHDAQPAQRAPQARPGDRSVTGDGHAPQAARDGEHRDLQWAVAAPLNSARAPSPCPATRGSR
jgi:hypothetical protein